MNHASFNKFFRLVWSAARGAWVAVAETANGHGRGAARRRRVVASAALAVAGQGAAAAPPPAATQLPTGGQVVAGQATLHQSGATLAVQQSSQRAAIDWQTFNLGSQARIDFLQPGASAVTLNRVLDANPSQLFGRIDAPGQVFIVNPSGVLFGPTAQVDVGGLVATTLPLSDADFMAGKTSFGRDGAAASGTVDNQGQLQARLGGYVALLAPQVRNEGVIVATEGSVALAAGNQVTLQFSGARPIAVQVDRAALDALVDNRHAIRADGGLVILAAGSANALLDTVINAGGSVQADTLAEHGGRIVLEGGARGVVAVSGTLAAAGADAGTHGGTVVATGDKVWIQDGARLDATGTAGGGSVLVGGGWHGEDASIAQASAVVVAAGATLDASATVRGDGGTVEAWSDITNAAGATRAWGTFLANGGAEGGDGGRIETSGHWLDASGARGGAAAARGKAGSWLLDPYDVTIGSGGSTNGSLSGGIWTPSGDNSTLLASDIQALLESGTSVTVTTGTGGGQMGDITVSAPITKTTGATDVTLTLKAADTIDIEAAITNTGGAGKLHVALDADDDNGVHDGGGAILLNADISTRGGHVDFGTGATMSLGGVATRVGGDVFVGGTGLRSITTGGGRVSVNGEMLIGNPSGLAITTSGGDVVLAGLVNSGDSYALDNTYREWNESLLANRSGTGANAGDTYLATITSRLENAIASRTAAYGSAWLGGHRGVTDGVTTTVDAGWRWVAGPEGLANGGTGTVFFTQTGQGTGTTTSGYYSNWSNGEPNNCDTNFGCGAPTDINGESALQFNGVAGRWNDLPDNIGPNPVGTLPSVVETNLAPAPLVIDAGSGHVTFGSAVGTLKPLASLSVTAGSTTLAGRLVTTVGTQDWHGAITAPTGMGLSASQVTLHDAATATAGNSALTATAGDVTLDAAFTASQGNITVTATGGGLVGSSAIELDGAAPRLTVSQDGNTTFAGVVGGAHAALVKAGTGTLGLSATNTYAGGSTLAGGELELDSPGAIGTTGTISFTGGALRFVGATTGDYSPRFSNAAHQAYWLDTDGQDIELDADLASAGGTLRKTGPSTLTLGGTNAYDGGTTIDAGRLFGGGGSMTRTAFGSGAITVNAGAELWTDRSWLANDLVLDGGTLHGSNGFGEVWTGHVTLAADSTIRPEYSIVLTGAITGSGRLDKVDTGTLLIAGADTATGTTTISSGTLQVGSGTAGSIAGDIADDGQLQFGRTDELVYGGAISGGGGLGMYGGGTIVLTTNPTYTGPTVVAAGSLVLRNDAPSLATSSILGAGSLVIEPASASFTHGFDVDLPLGGIGGLTIGKPGNNAAIDVTATTSVAGPIALYGGNVTLDAGLAITGSGAPILVQARGDIVQSPGVAVATDGGGVTFQSDADASGGGFIWLKGQGQATAITTGGGGITLSGGLDPATGHAQGRGSVNGNGVTLDDAVLDSSGGNILVRGRGTSGSGTSITTTDGAALNTDGVRTHGTTTIDAGSGAIAVDGIAPGLNSSNGIELSGAGGTTLRTSSGGGITLSGTSTNPAAQDSFGLYTWANTIEALGGGGITMSGTGRDGGLVVASGGRVLAPAGAITLQGTDSASSTALQVNGTVGQAASSDVTASTANVTLSADSLTVAGLVQAGGTLLIQPLKTTTSVGVGGASGTLQVPAGWFGSTIANDFQQVAIGNSAGTAPMTVGAFALDNFLWLQSGTGNIALTGQVANGQHPLVLATSGHVSEAAGGSVSTAALVLYGAGGTFTLRNADNQATNIDILAHGADYFNAGALTIGGFFGVTSDGPVSVATGTGNIEVHGPIATTSTAANAIVLNAGQSSAAGAASGGDVTFDANVPAPTTGTGGRTTIYTGSVAGSTGLADIVAAQAGSFRYGSNATTTAFTTALGNGLYAVYREQPVVTVTAADGSKVYDGHAFGGGFGVSGSGYVNGDTDATALAGSVSYGGSANGALNAGTYTITPGGLASGLGYALAYADGTLHVAPRTVTLTATKVYDGSTALADGDVTITTGVAGETLAATGATSSDAHVATTGKFIDAITLADGSGLASNYVLPTLDAANAPVTITPKTLVASAAIGGALSKTYDGTTAATGARVGGSVTGAVAGDTLALDASGVTLAYDGTHVVGTDAIVASGAAHLVIAHSSAGSLASDYDFTAPAIADAAASITPKTLSASASIAGATTKVYDGTAAATGASVQGSVGGGIAGDTLALDLSGVTLAYDGAHVVGTDAIVASGAARFVVAHSAAGSLASDYDFTAPTIAPVAAHITPRALGLAVGADDKAYDGTTAATVNLALASGLVGSETLGVSGTGSFDSKDVATAHVVTVDTVVLADGSGRASDYAVVAGETAAARIDPRAISVSAPVVAKVYDGNTLAAGTVTVGGAGMVAGETLAGATLAFDSPAVGTGKTVTPSGAVFGDGTPAGNYAVTYVADHAGVIAPNAPIELQALAPKLPFVAPTAAVPRIAAGPDTVHPADAAGTRVTLVAPPSSAGDGQVQVDVPASSTGSLSFALPHDVAAGATAAALPDGSALPAWLHFDAIGATFSATSVPAGGLPIDVVVIADGRRIVVSVRVVAH